MATLPQLIEEDISRLNAALHDFLAQTEAIAALLIDKGGFLITHQGEPGEMDFTTIGALASGAFMANQTIATLIKEKDFNSTYQQGETFSLFVINVDANCLLVVIFKSPTGIGVVKYYAANATISVARQLAIAAERAPGRGFDLSELNLANPQELFRKKAV
jgi:predicted regulator of Ras-like GTPase activity (Roadblock/LC7/MglB family)